MTTNEYSTDSDSIRLTGDSGIANVGGLHAQLLEQTSGDRSALVECSEATSVDVASMQVLLSAILQPGNQLNADVGDQNSGMAEALSLAGLTELFHAAQTDATTPASATQTTTASDNEVDATQITN